MTVSIVTWAVFLCCLGTVSLVCPDFWYNCLHYCFVNVLLLYTRVNYNLYLYHYWSVDIYLCKLIFSVK